MRERVRDARLVSHELLLDKASDAYRHLDNRDKGWTKVVLKPAE